MRYEIIHDTLANLVFSKASLDSQARRKAERYVKDKFQLRETEGIRMSEEDLEYIKPFLKQINMEDQYVDFLDEERRNLQKISRRRRAIFFAVSTLILLLAVFSIVKYIDLRKASFALLESKIEDINASIYQLDYEAANLNLEGALLIGENLQDFDPPVFLAVLSSAFQKAETFLLPPLEELYFFYVEAKDENAIRIYEKLRLFTSSLPGFPLEGDSLEFVLNNKMAVLSELRRIELESKYYPEMVWVEVVENDTLSPRKSYEIGRYEITGFQYKLYTQSKGITNSCPKWGCKGLLPQVNVSWLDSKDYCSWLSLQTGHSYDLPGDKQWVYAARGGSLIENFVYAGSNSIDSVGWTRNDKVKTPQRVGLKKCNRLGLYDMSGNVLEFTNDNYEQNTLGLDSVELLNISKLKSVRGGDYDSNYRRSKIERRAKFDQSGKYQNLGFRVVRNQ
ncbi:MAG: SUMF1/EgtB/PvdO family nonheme iron enzyme [Bacteroidia bacterium]|nr:SUMF1/EgtB/PvdO family nonheme iron enzyme [Bacteroidia bacterium]